MDSKPMNNMRNKWVKICQHYAHARKNWLAHNYSEFWIKQRQKYGFTRREQAQCATILQFVPRQSKGLEVAMGTGYPYCDYFIRQGFDIYGIDISERLVEIAKQNYPSGKYFQQDAENLEFDNNVFDFTLCFGSAQYFPNPVQALREMIRVTKGGNHIFFSIANSLNPMNRKHYRKIYIEQYPLMFCISVIKYILGRIKYIYWTPSERSVNPNKLYDFLKSQSYKEISVGFYVASEDGCGRIQYSNELLEFSEYSTLIFKIVK